MSTNRSEPIGHTCPEIDGVIKCIKDARRCLGDGEAGVDDAVYYLKGLENDLERLREANEKLRKWGNSLVDDLEEQDTRIEELENENETLKSKLDDAEEALKRYETESV